MLALAPEEIELNKKLALLERLKDRLADREEEMADLKAELEQRVEGGPRKQAEMIVELDAQHGAQREQHVGKPAVEVSDALHDVRTEVEVDEQKLAQGRNFGA